MMLTKHKLPNRVSIIAIIGVSAPALLIFIGIQKRQDSAPAVSTKPAQPIPTFMLPDNYAFRQDDSRWGAETIGQTEDSLRAYGCTIASVAMSASNLTQTEITPQILETRLSDAGGFTDRGWLIWSKVQAATDNQVTAKYYDSPRYEDINSCMAAGNYPVIKIKLYDSIVHWVMIIGTSKDEYLIRDPLVGEAAAGLIALSTRSSDIYSVRCIMKVAN